MLPLLLPLLLLILAHLTVVATECWTSSLYHQSAWALAKSIGPIDSDAVCVYGTDKSLNDECSPPCQALLMAVWGDCYCRNKDYKPSSFLGHVDKIVSGKSVRDIFHLFTNTTTKGGRSDLLGYITCRNWMKESENLDKINCLA